MCISKSEKWNLNSISRYSNQEISLTPLIYIYISSEIGELGETVLLRSHFHADKIDLYIHAVILYNIYIYIYVFNVERSNQFLLENDRFSRLEADIDSRQRLLLVREFEILLSVIWSADFACKTCSRVTASTGLPSDIGRRYQGILFFARLLIIAFFIFATFSHFFFFSLSFSPIFQSLLNFNSNL